MDQPTYIPGSSPASLSFVTLPTEIVDGILRELLLVSPTSIPIFIDDKLTLIMGGEIYVYLRRTDASGQVLRVCRRLYERGLAILYGQNEFSVDLGLNHRGMRHSFGIISPLNVVRRLSAPRSWINALHDPRFLEVFSSLRTLTVVEDKTTWAWGLEAETRIKCLTRQEAFHLHVQEGVRKQSSKRFGQYRESLQRFQVQHPQIEVHVVHSFAGLVRVPGVRGKRCAVEKCFAFPLEELVSAEAETTLPENESEKLEILHTTEIAC